ncbi:MAG TPA: hypothetical protein VKG92_02230, partial [Flavobacteriales bacterium]|nr:hypothetical protein [Flavobacteriales bacterium]
MSGPDGADNTDIQAADMNGDGDVDLVGESMGRLWISLGREGQLTISPTVELGGAYNAANGHHTDALRAGQLLPLIEPYTGLGYAHVGGGGESMDPSKLNVTGPDALVDWVVVELRDPANPAIRSATRSALVQRDGDVVDVDGVSPLRFDLPIASYHVAIRHRDHLGVMTASPIAFFAGVNTIDFTNPATLTWGTDAQNNVGGTMVLWPGDVNFDGVVKYMGANNDRDPILIAVGGSTPTNTVSNVYSAADVNMDGVIGYAGANNDRDIILQTIGGTVPTATRVQQLP